MRHALKLFYMGVVADVVLTIAMVAVAAGAVAELQLRIGNIGSAAYGAAVAVIGLLGCLPELHHPGTGRAVGLLSLYPPGEGK